MIEIKKDIKGEYIEINNGVGDNESISTIYIEYIIRIRILHDVTISEILSDFKFKDNEDQMEELIDYIEKRYKTLVETHTTKELMTRALGSEYTDLLNEVIEKRS